MTLGVEVGLGPGHNVLDGDPAAPPSPKGQSPKFSAHICCGQMVGWIKMPLGMEEGLGPGDFMLDGETAPSPKKGAEPPQIFGPCLFWPNGWIDQNSTWHGGGPWFRPHCARWRPSSPPQKGDRAPNFKTILLWPKGWMDQDATWCGGRPQPRQLCGRWGPSPLPKKGRSPQFSAHVYCGQMAAWIKMHLVRM